MNLSELLKVTALAAPLSLPATIAVWYSIPWQTSLTVIGFHAYASSAMYKPIDGSFLHSVSAAVFRTL